jgi:AcrR family transcriptional regulator
VIKLGNKQTTEQKIMTAFTQLLQKQGYEQTTTRQIAEAAEVNEVTIFRHFKKKANIFRAIVKEYLVKIEQINSSFTPTGNLETDLVQIANEYRKQINNNREFFLLGLRMLHTDATLDAIMLELPQKTHQLVIADFKQLQHHGEIDAAIDIDAEAQNFVYMNYGHFVFQAIYQLDNDWEYFLQHNVKSFAQRLQ